MISQKTPRLALKIMVLTVLLLLAISAGVLLREYLLLRKIQATLRQPPSQTINEPHHNTPVATKVVPEAPLVSAVSRSADGRYIRARANFYVFKKQVEANPERLQQWGHLVWKIVENMPALCIRSLTNDAPFRPLGVRAGDCITHIDGESINQPMRNMGIWLTLPARSRLRIDTLRNGKRISYELLRK